MCNLYHRTKGPKAIRDRDANRLINDGMRREDGSELMLGFPHAELPNIAECAAMDKGREKQT